jgi:hypothetical protein
VQTTLDHTLEDILLETTDPASVVRAAVDAVLVRAVAAEIRTLRAITKGIHAEDVAAVSLVVN